ncbi:MAG TPA: YfhO family protein [Thermoanaerobaculia bacterium]|nr:YfhO family protein [Thermoanaerobaculia bacterium]
MSLLPGLYLTFLAFLLAWALRRWWDPMPARVWAVFAILILVLFGPALFLGKVLLPVDILPGVVPVEKVGALPEGNKLQLDLVTQIIPWQAEVRRAVRSGAWPLWNGLTGAGMPLLADPQSQVFQPLVLLAMPFPLPQAVGVTAALRVLIALVFFFLLLRRQGLSEGPALFGSVAFGLGGFLLLWLSWPIGNSPALLPLVLYALVMTGDRGARRDFLLLIAALAALLAGGHPETILYVVIVGGLFALARLRGRAARERPGLLGRWALAGGIALGLAAPALVPTFRLLPQTHRDHMVEQRKERMEERAALAGWRTPEERRKTRQGIEKRFVAVFAPNAFGNSRYGVYWGDANTNEDASAFVGGAALLAALLAFVPAARRAPQERLFLALAAASFLIAVRVPGVPRVLAALPVLSESISAHRRLLLVLGFSLAYLAACVLERWRTGEGPKRWTVAACAAVLLGLIAWAYLLSPEVTALLPSRRIWMGVQLAAVAAAALVLIRRKPSSLWLLTGLAAVELLMIHRPANPSLPRSGFYPTTPTIGFLQENASGFRVAGLGDRLLPNAPSVYGLADIRISNPFKPFTYVQALAPVSASIRATEHILLKAEHPLYQLLGVRYVIAPPRMRSRPGWRAVFRDPTARIFERAKILPRLFLPEAAEPPGALAWTEWLAANPDFAARALVLAIPGPNPGRAATWTAARPAESAVEILGIEPARVTARGLLAEERLLASSIYQDGGWALLLDGRRHPTVTANGPFLGAWLPAGEHRVELVYRAPGFLLGLVLAAVALAGAAGWLTPRP